MDEDFNKMFTKGFSLVTVNVIYFLPDQPSLINEFLWQTLDLKPKYPRIERFLDFWTREIEAEIKEVHLADSDSFLPRSFRHIEEIRQSLNWKSPL